MKILLSGASSFTGYWFARELRRAGHDVTCTFRGASSLDYDGLRGERVEQLVNAGDAVFSCSFGTPNFLELAAEGWDIYAHHAADVTNYRSLDFDVLSAVRNNTANLRSVIENLKDGGCRRIVLTGSVFEQGEGAGSDGLPAILPYGLSKGLTAQIFSFEGALADIHLGKFIIPNPFGLYQEPRFVQYLINTWRQNATARVATPAYVRDNIPVQLLAMEYRHFLENLPLSPGFSRRAPSGIISDQGAFAQLVAHEIKGRLGWPCAVELAKQTEFNEPLIRINTDSALASHPQWTLASVWDQLAEAAIAEGH